MPEAERTTLPLPPSKLAAIPPRGGAELDVNEEVAASAKLAAQRRSEAKRDGIIAVALAIKRRGGDPMSDWTINDADTAYAIADQLTMLDGAHR